MLSATLIAGLVQSQAWADPQPADDLPARSAADALVRPSKVPPADRDKVLGRDWKESADRAWTTTGDAAGFHLLAADQKAGYAWRTAATLSEPGFDTDMWIGNACVTGSGKRAVVAYAPRSFTNKPELMARGAFTAVVDLGSSAVTKLNRQASLAYFSPRCGTGETAVFTQAGGESKNATRLLTVDASTAKLGRTVELQGQVTSAVPIGKDIVAADAARLTRIDPSGRRTALAHTGQVPFELTADSDGGVVYMDRPAGSGTRGEVRRITAADISRADATKTRPAVLARGPSSGGTQDDPWAIDWAEADCGYGITQVTDGMRMHGREKPGEKPLTTLQQEAVALDYTANVAAGVNILIDKWNQTRKDGLTANGGDPKYLENWFFALWAYNAGYYPKASAGANGGMWGVGYTNNPANPLWKANRTPFLESPSGGNDYSQAAHPQDWPYQEKVLGWAARPLEGLESPGNMVSGFRPAWWTNDSLRTKMKPAEGLFCTASNNCDASKIGPNDKNEPGLGACNRADLKCWWNQPVKWKDCTKAECGNEILRFNDTYAEEADGTAYPPNCSTQGLPANALIVDNTPNSYASPRGGCSLLKPSAGTFDLDFASPSARIDFQQLGAGYGGHFWFAHTRKPGADGGRMKVTGTWKLDKPMTGAAEVLVHLPDHGAHTTQAAYDIKSIARTTRKVISQPGMANRWVSLGIQNFKGVIPEVSLSSETPDGTGDQDVAFDAVAFAPKTTTGGVPQLVLQDADPNAPDVVFGEDARPIPANRAAFKSPANSCRPVPGDAGREMCVQTTSLEGKAVPNSRGPGARAAALTCSTGIEMSSYSRFQACAVTKLKLILFENNVPVGTGEFVVDHDIRLTATKTEIYQALNIKPVEIQPQLGTVSLDLNFICGGACSTEPPISVIDGVWTAGQTHTATITSKSKWVSSDPTKKVHDFLDLKWTVTATAVGGKAKSVPHTWTKDALTVRCDNEVGGNSGCVFPSYIPDFELNYEKYPVAASLYWVIWKKLQGGNFPGNKDKNSPLTRLANDAAAKTNRSRMCSKSATNFVPNPAGASCDEYPFAKSRQSGGLKTDASGAPLKGTACAQFSAVQNTQTKKWSLHYDSNYALPTWNEPCGRGSIPTQQNTDAGGDLGRFTVAVRLIDSDPYYPVVPELENCKVEEVCTVMPRP
ncbi:hypothetical protein [Streptomyces sp. NPDC002994]|uniref:golvesin C-terminal-like domain-containing protein n=1 Tax=Streptomyces sp. NPDC002994 TaxID=3154441 RepID=UPI0033A95DCB